MKFLKWIVKSIVVIISLIALLIGGYWLVSQYDIWQANSDTKELYEKIDIGMKMKEVFNLYGENTKIAIWHPGDEGSEAPMPKNKNVDGEYSVLIPHKTETVNGGDWSSAMTGADRIGIVTDGSVYNNDSVIKHAIYMSGNREIIDEKE